VETLIGKVIVNFREMTDAEMEAEGWQGAPGYALVLDDGTVLYPSQDEEGNGPGVLFGLESDGTKVSYGD
jgi:hypothetical protein